MKNNVRMLPILLVLVIILGGCKGSFFNPIIPSDPVVDPRCPTGTTLSDIETDENTYTKLDYDGYWRIQYVKTFIVSPNEGCNLPIQYCVLTHSEHYGASVSCTTIP